MKNKKTKTKTKKGRGPRNNGWRAFALLICAIVVMLLVVYQWDYVQPVALRALELVWNVKKDVIELVRYLLGIRNRKA